jgi:hypothetical protein
MTQDWDCGLTLMQRPHIPWNTLLWPVVEQVVELETKTWVAAVVVAAVLLQTQNQFLLELHIPLLLVVVVQVERLLRPQAVLIARQILIPQKPQ